MNNPQSPPYSMLSTDSSREQIPMSNTDHFPLALPLLRFLGCSFLGFLLGASASFAAESKAPIDSAVSIKRMAVQSTGFWRRITAEALPFALWEEGHCLFRGAK